MSDTIPARPRSVIGPDGQRLTRQDLPPADTERWVIRRKAEVVAAVRGDLLSLDAPLGVVMCDEVAWAFAGLSMATWNAVFSFALAAIWVKALATRP